MRCRSSEAQNVCGTGDPQLTLWADQSRRYAAKKREPGTVASQQDQRASACFVPRNNPSPSHPGITARAVMSPVESAVMCR